METVRIFPLRNLTTPERVRLRAAQMEAARVWMYCVERHRQARAAHRPWPSRDDLQRETKGGQYALQSQAIQMVTHQFLANVETIAELRKTDKRHRYPYHPKKYLTVEWSAQAISRHGNTLILPMGRGRKSFTYHLAGLPEYIGAVSLVWNGGYELHIVVSSAVRRGRVAIARCAMPSNASRGRRNGKCGIYGTKRRAKRQVVGFCQQEGVQTVFIGNPDGVRKKDAGRHHNQRMARWEYGKDKRYLAEKCQQAHMTSFTGSERGTSSRCPSCDKRQKPRGRIFACGRCGFRGHRDVVGSLNMHPLAFGSRIEYPPWLTYRRPGPARVRRRDEQSLPVARTGTS